MSTESDPLPGDRLSMFNWVGCLAGCLSGALFFVLSSVAIVAAMWAAYELDLTQMGGDRAIPVGGVGGLLCGGLGGALVMALVNWLRGVGAESDGAEP